jgi:hypothetical protein
MKAQPKATFWFLFSFVGHWYCLYLFELSLKGRKFCKNRQFLKKKFIIVHSYGGEQSRSPHFGVTQIGWSAGPTDRSVGVT